MVRLWRLFKRLTNIGFPKRFPIIQFPNAPLIIAFIAGMVAGVPAVQLTPTRSCLSARRVGSS
jgi:hypothetical protein